ncbi:MAG TPA: ABC transporter permease [Fastidiosipila sp.]|nr:ABC transporter permease [Fastidiosipila sp.]
MRKYEVRYSLRDSWQNIVRHPLVLIASVTTVALMLLLMSFYVAFSLNAAHLVEVASKQPPIQLTMNTDIDEQQLIEMDQFLTNDERVMEFQRFSPEENLENFKVDMGKEELFEEESLLHVFPYTYSIRLNDAAFSEEFSEDVEIMPGVFKVKLQLAIMEWLDSLTRTVNQVGIAAFAVLAIISILVVANMVRVSVLSRATEIGIMKYVGATNLYVRIPFIVEGMFAGFIGAFVATLVSGLVYSGLTSASGGQADNVLGRMAEEFALLPTSQIVLTVLILNIVIGLSLCVLASLMSVKRHINV